MSTKKGPAKKTGPRNKGGRPSKYTPELMAAICERLSRGEPMAVICRDKGMPDPSTVWDWQQKWPEVSQAIARAREEGFDAIAHRARATARGRGEDAEGDSTGDVQRDKLIIDTDLKLLAKWDPKRYGDKVAIGGAHDLPPVQHSIDASRLSDAALQELLSVRRAEADRG